MTLDLAAIRAAAMPCGRRPPASWTGHTTTLALCDEVERLQENNDALRGLLEDVAAGTVTHVANIAEPIHGIQVGGGFLRTHAPDKCSGEHCAIHNASDHPMRDWPMNWRADRGLLERICPHGLGHPDPDHIAHTRRLRGDAAARTESSHGCDGCGHNKETP